MDEIRTGRVERWIVFLWTGGWRELLKIGEDSRQSSRKEL